MTQETELPALPKVGPICYASAQDVLLYKDAPAVGRHIPGVFDVALWSTDQMRAYATAAVLAERERLLALANSRADHEGRLMRHAAMLDLIDAVFGARPSAVKEG